MQHAPQPERQSMGGAWWRSGREQDSGPAHRPPPRAAARLAGRQAALGRQGRRAIFARRTPAPRDDRRERPGSGSGRLSFDRRGGGGTVAAAMLNPVIQSLLVLQDRDLKRLGLEAQLQAIPGDIQQVETKIAAEKAALDGARTALRELETRKKLLETEIGSAETKVGQYRTQQLSIRKNDEYQAMGHQIETVLAQIGELEGQELEVMYEIDEAKKRLAAAEAEMKANISGHEARIALLREREKTVTAELVGAKDEVEAARTPVEPFRLRVYDRIAARNMPAVVSIHAGKCSGCHLKVSSEVESATRGKVLDPLAQLPTCDQCGRVVYWES